MHRHQYPGQTEGQMLVTSPGCSLNCNGLSMHLPPLGERSDYGSNYMSPPMSASYSQSRFDDHLHTTQNSNHYSIPKGSHIQTSAKRSSGQTNSFNANSSIPKYNRSELKVSNNGVLPNGVNGTNEGSAKAMSDWQDTFSPTTQDAPEGQLVPGPPGIARRAKAHVPSACVNCKKKHLACETKRPCNRCVQNGKESSCVDVQHKKRGRPRLREDDSFRELNLPSGSSYSDTYQSQNASITASQSGRHRSKTYRELRSQPEMPYVDSRPRTSDPSYNNPYPGALLDYTNSVSAGSYRSSNTPTVLLTPDFVVVQHNRAFSDALFLQVAARGQTLLDLVVPAERDKIRRLQALMRAEYQNAIQSARRQGDLNTIDTMPSIEQLDVVRATSGFQTRSEYWTFRLPRDQSRGFPICISLARDGGHFVVLTLINSTTSLHQVASPTTFQQSMMMPSNSAGGMPSPPNSVYQSQPSRHQRNSPSDTGLPYMSPGTSYEGQLLQFNANMGPYKPISPPRSVVAPYATPRTNSSGSASVSGSEMIRNSPSSNQQVLPRDNLKHLQLPPILTGTTPTSDPSTPRDAHRRRHGTNTPSPARHGTNAAKRKKRRRLEIGDVLH